MRKIVVKRDLKVNICSTVPSKYCQANTNEILVAHYDNDVWTKRKAPPPDWDKTLPEWLQKRNENTLLEVKSRQAKGEDIALVGERYLCTIM